MGSYNITCGLSGQVIATGDKCRVIPILQQSTFSKVGLTLGDLELGMYGVANTTCHPGSHWSPITGFISGVYEDYGHILPDDTTANRLVMADFFGRLLRDSPVVSQGENACHDVPFNLPAFMAAKTPLLALRYQEAGRFEPVNLDGVSFDLLETVWDYIWEVAEEHRLFLRDSGRVRPLQFAAFHSAATDYLITWTSDSKGWDGASYELGALLKRNLTEMGQRAAELRATDSEKKFYYRMQLRDGLNLNLSSGASSVLLPFTHGHMSWIDQLLDEGLPFPDFVERMRPSMEGVYILKGMDDLNLKFSPIVYAGQDYENGQGKAFAKFVGNVAKAVTKGCAARFE